MCTSVRKTNIPKMKKSLLLLLLLIYLIISCNKNSDEPIVSNHTIIQSVKIFVPIAGPVSTSSYSGTGFSPLYNHTNGIANYSIQDIDVKSVSYRFKNLNTDKDIILDSYSISFNAIEIINITNTINLSQLINYGNIPIEENQELFEQLSDGILINSHVHTSSFGIMHWDGSPNSFEIEVIINIDVIEKNY